MVPTSRAPVPRPPRYVARHSMRSSSNHRYCRPQPGRTCLQHPQPESQLAPRRRRTHTVGYPSAGAEFPTSASFSSLFRRLRLLLSFHSHSSLRCSSCRRRSSYCAQSLRNCCRPLSSSSPAYLLLVARWDFRSLRSGFQLSSLCRGREASAIVLPVVTGSGEVVVLGESVYGVGGCDDVGAASAPARARSAASVGASSMPTSLS